MKSLLLALVLIVQCHTMKTCEIREHVDKIELNHKYNEHGRLEYSQFIYYEWIDSCCEYKVRSYIGVNRIREAPWVWPERLESANLYKLRYYDLNCKVQREITSSVFTVTWTKEDREQENTKLFDPCGRTLLIGEEPEAVP